MHTPLRRSPAASGSAFPPATDETLDVHVPMELKRRGGKKEIISARSPSGLPPGAHTPADVGPRRPIVVALARAHAWQKMLDSGQAGSTAELARKYDVDRSYVGRMLKLTSLAPDIVEAVLAGDEPSGLSLACFREGMPVRWDQQRQRWLNQ